MNGGKSRVAKIGNNQSRNMSYSKEIGLLDSNSSQVYKLDTVQSTFGGGAPLESSKQILRSYSQNADSELKPSAFRSQDSSGYKPLSHVSHFRAQDQAACSKGGNIA